MHEVALTSSSTHESVVFAEVFAIEIDINNGNL